MSLHEVLDRLYSEDGFQAAVGHLSAHAGRLREDIFGNGMVVSYVASYLGKRFVRNDDNAPAAASPITADQERLFHVLRAEGIEVPAAGPQGPGMDILVALLIQLAKRLLEEWLSQKT